MKRILKNIIYSILSLFNFNGTTILMYHSILDNDNFFTVKPEDFEKQMKYLKKKKYNVISLEEFYNIIENKKEIFKKTIILTFDDGYEDNYLYAFPVLKKYNFFATIFISTALIGKITIARNGSEMKILTEKQIKEMAKSGLIEFGSHGHHHLKFTKLSKQEAENEFLISSKILKKIIGKEILSFACPYGKYNDMIKSLAGERYKIVCGIKKGKIKQSKDFLLLKRNSIDSEVSFAQFKGIIKFGRI